MLAWIVSVRHVACATAAPQAAQDVGIANGFHTYFGMVSVQGFI